MICLPISKVLLKEFFGLRKKFDLSGFKISIEKTIVAGGINGLSINKDFDKKNFQNSKIFTSKIFNFEIFWTSSKFDAAIAGPNQKRLLQILDMSYI